MAAAGNNADAAPQYPAACGHVIAVSATDASDALASFSSYGGTVALAGIYMTPVPPMDYGECLFHEKNLRSVEANTRADGEELLREAAEIPIRPEVTTSRPSSPGRW